MSATKKRWRKTGGVLGYHFIQSFAPGEVTPEQAHEIGMEFARRMFGERYEVVIGTHLDKAHLHNHIVINSVSFVDGQKYHSSPESYYNEVRGTSDELCRENDLSVITPQGKGKHYGEWKAEQDGRPTVRSIIREDIDRIIGEAYTYQTFLLLLQRNGYAIKSGPNRKYTAVRPPGAKRFKQLAGDSYIDDDLIFAHEDGTHISSQYADDMFRSLYEPLGLPKVDLYSLRHFSITKKLDYNRHDYVSLAKDTAHRQLSTIQDYYETPEDSVRIDTAKAIGKFLSRSGKSDSESKVTISLADEDFAKKLEEVASDSAGKQMLEFAIAMYEKNNSGK